MLKVYLSTNGCEEAQLSSMEVEQFFDKNEATIVRDPTQADLIIFFACGLTDQREKDSLMIIRKLQAKKKTSARLAVWGCLPKINPQSLASVYDGPILGPMDTSFFEEILGKTKISFDNVSANTLVSKETPGLPSSSPSGLCNGHYTDAFIDAVILLKKGVEKLRFLKQKILIKTPFYIRVATGCTGHCTYCSERCAWGKIKSRPTDKIISEFERGLQKGYNRFFLVAADLGAYGKDIGRTLSDLLGRIIKTGNSKNYKMILNQISPSHLKELFFDLEDTFASGKVELLCSPVQSGSNSILKLMGRMYTAEEWKECMLKIHRRFPDIRLKTHLMVGFPTETDEDFRATLKLLDYPLFLDEIGIFKFSQRPTVFASRIPGQVPERTKELRYRKLLRKYAYRYAFNFPMSCRRIIL